VSPPEFPVKKRRHWAAVGSKLYDVVQRAALRTTGTFHIAIVGVNEAALFATENMVFARCWLEAPPTMFGIYCHAGKCRKQNNDISKDECGNAHE
jgi:hypothetical protein